MCTERCIKAYSILWPQICHYSNMQRLSSSSPQRPSTIATSANGRKSLVVQAFLGRTQLHKAAKCMPSPFFKPASEDCPVELLTPEAKIQGSHWANDYLPQDAQGAAAFDYISRLQTAYTPANTDEFFVAADENNHNAFVFFSSQLINTGNFAHAPPTGKPSTVVGLYRLQCDTEADLVSDVWLFRSGTEEERQHLLRHGLVNTHPVHEWSVAPGTDTTSHTISLAPCKWVVDAPLTAAMMHNAGLWTKEVMSQGCMTSMMRVVSNDIVMYDGTGLLHDPLDGPAAVGHIIVDMITRCDLAPRVLSAQVQEQNKVFQHWKQARTCRASGKHSQVQGATLLVFDSKARVKQAFEFMSLDNELHGHIFDEEAAKRLLGCWPEPTSSACDVAAMRAAAEQAKAEEARQQAECLKRQEQEWMSW